MRNRVLSILMVLTIMATMCFSCCSLVSGKTVNGDANGDDEVNMKDVLQIRKYISGMVEEYNIDIMAADCNQDVSVDMKDVLLLRKYLAHMEPLPSIGTTSTGSTTTENNTPTTTQKPAEQTATLKLSITEESPRYEEHTIQESWDYIVGTLAKFTVSMNVYKASEKSKDELVSYISLPGASLVGDPSIGEPVEQSSEVTYTYEVLVDKNKTLTGTIQNPDFNPATIKNLGGTVVTTTTVKTTSTTVSSSKTTQPSGTTKKTEPGETTGVTYPTYSRVPTQSTHHEPIDFSSRPQLNIPGINGTTKTLGTWWWFYADGVRIETREKYLDFCKYNGITEIYYYCYALMGTANYRQETHEFIESAMRRGIRCSVLYDDPKSQEVDNTYFTDHVVHDYLLYKQEYPSDWLYGIHCDVEHKVSAANAQKYVDNFLLPEVVPAIQQGVYVELDLSVNYTSGIQVNYTGSPIHEYSGTKADFYTIVAHNCNTMCMMSYRTSADALERSTEYCRSIAKVANCRILFGIELGDSGEGNGVDFSKKSAQTAYNVLEEFDSRLKASDFPAGYGYVIHHTRVWFELRDT